MEEVEGGLTWTLCRTCQRSLPGPSSTSREAPAVGEPCHRRTTHGATSRRSAKERKKKKVHVEEELQLDQAFVSLRKIIHLFTWINRKCLNSRIESTKGHNSLTRPQTTDINLGHALRLGSRPPALDL